jgi:ribosomal protein S8
MALGSVSERIRLTEGTRGNVIWASYLLNTRKGGLYAFICPSVNGVATAIIITMSEQGMLQSWRAMETGFVFIDARVESQQGNVLVVLGRKSEGSVVTKRVLLSSSTIEIYEKSKTNAQDYNRGLELRETDVDTIRRQCLEWLNT